MDPATITSHTIISNAMNISSDKNHIENVITIPPKATQKEDIKYFKAALLEEPENKKPEKNKEDEAFLCCACFDLCCCVGNLWISIAHCFSVLNYLCSNCDGGS